MFLGYTERHMANFEVKIEGLVDFEKALNASPQVAEQYLQRAINAGAAEISKNAVRGVVPWKTGRLVQSFGEGTVLGRLFASIAPTVEYAIFVHEGTKPHKIFARPGGGLMFPGAAHPMKSVNHPGNKPNPFMPRIIEKATPRINDHFTDALTKIVETLAK